MFEVPGRIRFFCALGVRCPVCPSWTCWVRRPHPWKLLSGYAGHDKGTHPQNAAIHWAMYARTAAHSWCTESQRQGAPPDQGWASLRMRTTRPRDVRRRTRTKEILIYFVVWVRCGQVYRYEIRLCEEDVLIVLTAHRRKFQNFPQRRTCPCTS